MATARARTEPRLLSHHGSSEGAAVSLAALFLEHTALGEQFELAIRDVLGASQSGDADHAQGVIPVAASPAAFSAALVSKELRPTPSSSLSPAVPSSDDSGSTNSSDTSSQVPPSVPDSAAVACKASLATLSGAAGGTSGPLATALRAQFATSLYAVLHRLEETSDSTERGGVQGKFGKAPVHRGMPPLPPRPSRAHTVEFSARIKQYNGHHGAFHFQTDGDSGELRTPAKSRFAELPRNNLERAAVARNLPVSMLRIGTGEAAAAAHASVRHDNRTYLTEPIRPLDVWCTTL